MVLEAAQEWPSPGRAMALLAPCLQQLLRLLGGFQRLLGIACVRGPGSFTGIRVILSTAEGVMAATGVPLAGLELPDLLAEAAPRRWPESGGTARSDEESGTEISTLAVVTYARRGQVYLRLYGPAAPAAPADPADLADLADEGGAPFHPLGPVAALTAGAALEVLSALPGPVHALGSGLRKNADVFLSPGSPLIVLPARLDSPAPAAMLAVAARAEYASRPVEPLYVRPSDAEENLPDIAGARGLPADEAQRLLALFRDAILPKN
ncbi:universal protein YeaZ [Desulfovibrio sp. X2]|nr:universal protein YeaZ [Desulfovibrio sp. X2]